MEPSESLNEYDIDTTEYVELVATYLEGGLTSAMLIDVREPEELVESGQIPGTINIPRMYVCTLVQIHPHTSD